VSTAHFKFAGCFELLLSEDLADAWADIDSVGQDNASAWKFIFDAKEHELLNNESNIEQYRLEDVELELVAKKVTRLRQLAKRNAENIRAFGDLSDLPQVPPEITQHEIDE
jgi:hypothetical protein